MARIPTQSVPQVQSQRGPVVFQDTGDTQGAFGEGQARVAQTDAAKQAQQGQALQQSAQGLRELAVRRAEAEARLDAQDDAVIRAEARNTLSTRLNELTNLEKSENNFKNDEALKNYRNGVNETTNSTLREFAGRLKSPESAAKLAAEFEQARGQFDADAVNSSLKQRRSIIDQDFSRDLARVTDIVSKSPAHLNDAIASVSQLVEDRYGNFSSSEELQGIRNAAVQSLATASVDFYLSRGDVERAQEVLDQPIVRDALDPARARDFRLLIGKQQGEAVQNEAKAQNIQSVLTAVDPTIVLTSQQMRQAAQLSVSSNPSVEELASIYAQVTGRQPSLVVQQRIQETFAATAPTIGTSTQQADIARSLGGTARLILQDAPLSVDDKVNFVQLAALSTASNPVSGAKGVVSPIVRAALDKMGINADALDRDQLDAVRALIQGGRQLPSFQPGGSREPTAGAAEPSDAQLTEATQAVAEVEQTLKPLVAVLESNPPAQGETDNETFQRQGKIGLKFFEIANSLTGPVSTFRKFVFGFPVVGDLVESGPALATVTQEYEIFKTALVSALRRTSKFADAERQDLQQKTLATLQGREFLQNPDEFAASLVGLDNFLAEETQRAEETLADPRKLSAEGKAEAEDRVQISKFARSLIGVPSPLLSFDELRAAVSSGDLQLGDRFVARVVNDRGEEENKLYTLTDSLLRDAQTVVAPEEPAEADEPAAAPPQVQPTRGPAAGRTQ